MRQLALVLGANGQLGQAMTLGLAARHEVVPFTRRDLDITSADDVCQRIAAIYPDVIVNCTAFTDVDGSERDPLTAFAVNGWAVRAMARVATDIDAALIHFSTDFVFDGTAEAPPTEETPPNPRSTYGMSKLLGEWLAADTPRHYVLRVASLFGGPLARSSIDRIINGIRAGEPVRAFLDRTVSPSNVEDVVQATSMLLSGNGPYGLYHCVNTGGTTWLDLAREAERRLRVTRSHVIPIRADELALVARRPLRAALSNAKLRAAGVPMPTWQDALARHISEMA